MKVGLLYCLRNPQQPGWFVPWPEYYAQALDHVEAMDRLGFYSISFAEHHFDPTGYDPSVLVMMTAAALRTQRAVIAQNIVQLPYHHPVRLAEDLATIDILSGGRVGLYIGGGATTFDAESHAFGINPKERYGRTTEAMDIIRRCWTEEVFSHEGRYFNLQDVRVYPKPLQQPHPPMFVTANNPHSMDRAARMGINAVCLGGNHFGPLGNKEQWLDWRGRWHEALAKRGRNPADFKTNAFGTCFVTDDPEREWAKHREAIFYHITYKRFDGAQPYLRAAGMTSPEKPEDIPNWQNIFRTPEDCVKHLRETFSGSAPDELLVVADNTGIPWNDLHEYHRNFAEKVLPHIQDLPVRS